MAKKKPIVQDEEQPTLTIDDMARLTGLSAQYIRVCIRNKMIPTVLVPVREGVSTKHHLAKVSDFELFRDRQNTRSRRADNRNKWVIYMTPVESVRIKQLLRENGYVDVAETITTANPLKTIADTNVILGEEQ